MGVGAVTTYLIADEVERSRCGIGCVLEDDTDGQIRIAKVMRGGAADNQGIDVGDVIEQIDETRVTKDTKFAEVSYLVKGMEGSIVTLVLRKKSGESVTVRLVRARVPGSKAEMLGALWQTRGGYAKKEFKELTMNDKLDKLAELRRRGNLTEKEYQKARYRLLGEEPPPPPDEGSLGFLSQWWGALKEDFHKLTADPEVEKRKAQLRAQRGEGTPTSSPLASSPLTPPPPSIPSSPIRQNITQKLQEQANLSPESKAMALQDEQEILAELARRAAQDENIKVV
mmetsp:Transcript_12998/g.30916  ORF Transcript_12998/g.30916 Transcript_12998/m.30916 type:complete len:284 (+) Transcript_12998:109-960(+)